MLYRACSGLFCTQKEKKAQHTSNISIVFPTLSWQEDAKDEWLQINLSYKAKQNAHQSNQKVLRVQYKNRVQKRSTVQQIN